MDSIEHPLNCGIDWVHARSVAALEALEVVVVAHCDRAHRTLGWIGASAQVWPQRAADGAWHGEGLGASMGFAMCGLLPTIEFEQACLRLGCGQWLAGLLRAASAFTETGAWAKGAVGARGNSPPARRKAPVIGPAATGEVIS
ncbi:MAG: hypothetical protein KDG55_10570 [Rhodocyclaceae bacterium]|nr:hypothetical protein [Rhodocyclaceae bacterium]